MYIHTSSDTYIEKFTFNEKVDYSPDEIIHIKDNSFYSIYRGISRLKPALRTMVLMKNMREFQDTFFKNGAIPGLVLKSPNTLSEKIKERMMVSWQARYNPKSGGRRPLILDGGIEVDKLSNVSFKDLDFQDSIEKNEKIILKALGVPPILLDSGNNANIRPNMRMYYLETIIPIVRKLNHGLERYFGFQVKEDISDIPALQPELRDAAAYYTSLVNGGIITPAEARERLGFDIMEGTEEIRVPANIAGSAANPSEGGRPVETEGTDDEN
jgi:HK97 family phage portal protein